MIKDCFKEWDPVQDGIDFRKVSTPSTTRVVVITFDERYPDEAPTSVWKTLPMHFRKISDDVRVFKDYEATDARFLQELEDGKNAHFFIFYANGHGLSDLLSMWCPETGKRRNVKAAEIWERLRDAKNRFVLMFDACYSGSQIDAQMGENEPPRLASAAPAGEDGFMLPGELARMFCEDRVRLKSSGGAQPMFQIWASTPDKHYSYYEPTSSTRFSNAVSSAFKKGQNDRLSEFWERVKAAGSMNTSKDPSDSWYVVPQRSKYGEDFDSGFVM